MLRLGVGQTNLRLGDVDYNIDQTSKLLETASESNVDVLVLPELANSGYCFDTMEEAKKTSENIPRGPYSRLLRKWSKSGGFVLAGMLEREYDILFNSAAAFANGKFFGVYRKVHLYGDENTWFQPGNKEPPVFDFEDFRIGVLICFEWMFPEMVRILALQGAQIILHPTNSGSAFWRTAMRTRSVENRVFTASSNRIGKERWFPFSGGSQITNPRGKRLLKMKRDESGVGWVDIEPNDADDKMISDVNHLLDGRKISVYGRLLSKK
jgi:predicted amidohydrolase